MGVKLKLKELFWSGAVKEGMLILLEDKPPLLIGHATLSRQPSNNDGGIGWDDEYLESAVMGLRQIDIDKLVESTPWD